MTLPERRCRASQACNGSAMPRSRAMHRSFCCRRHHHRRVNLLERCCERTRTARHRALYERRRLRHVAAILLRQRGENSAGAVIKPARPERRRSRTTTVPARPSRTSPSHPLSEGMRATHAGEPPWSSAAASGPSWGFFDDALARAGGATSSKIVAGVAGVARDLYRGV